MAAMKKPAPIEFLEHAQSDKNTSAKVQAALETGRRSHGR
jgi:hypothetical protein